MKNCKVRPKKNSYFRRGPISPPKKPGPKKPQWKPCSPPPQKVSKPFVLGESPPKSLKKQLNPKPSNHPTIHPSNPIFLKRKHTIVPSNHPSCHFFLGFSRYGIGYDRHARWSASSRHLPNRPNEMNGLERDPTPWKVGEVEDFWKKNTKKSVQFRKTLKASRNMLKPLKIGQTCPKRKMNHLPTPQFFRGVCWFKGE